MSNAETRRDGDADLRRKGRRTVIGCSILASVGVVTVVLNEVMAIRDQAREEIFIQEVIDSRALGPDIKNFGDYQRAIRRAELSQEILGLTDACIDARPPSKKRECIPVEGTPVFELHQAAKDIIEQQRSRETVIAIQRRSRLGK